MSKLKPGVYHNVDFDTYAAWPAVNHGLLHHFRKTPAHAHYARTHDEESKAKALGWLVHLAVLEPEKFRDEVVIAPKVDKRTKVGKAEWARFEKASEGKYIASPDDHEVAQTILQNIEGHAFARELIRAEGAQELSMVWRDEATGVLCKGRIDRLTMVSDAPIVVDVKTVGKPASTHSFQQSVQEYGYHDQAAFYLMGLMKLVPQEEIPKFAWVACETKPPNLVRVFEAEEEALAIGADNMAKALRTFKECDDSGFWPGWGDGMDTAGLPPWVYKRYDVE